MRSLLIMVCGSLMLVAPLGAIGLTTSEPLPGTTLAWYFRIRPWETRRRHAVYRRLGVRLFQRGLFFWYDHVLFWAYWLIGVRLWKQQPIALDVWRQRNGQHLESGVRCGDTLVAARRRTERFELIHLFIALPILPIVLCLHISGHQFTSILLEVLTLVTNIYPIFLQRYNRHRIQKLTRHFR